MDAHVRVDLDDDGPVVVKSATGAGADRLRHERERLERAVHPGVVALASPAVGPGADGADEGVDEGVDDGVDERIGEGVDEHEIRTCYAGESLSRWTGSLPAVAGVGAAVASTLADLHDLGIVHGRLDATHILIGHDGRPRLCGLAHEGDAPSTDDVAALGAVLSELVARAPAGRRGLRPWPRAAGGASGRALHQVVERATDPVPTRRPTARGLADAILAAVPAATLSSGAAGTTGAASLRPRPASPLVDRDRDLAAAGTGSTDTGGADAPAQPDTLDRIWSFADGRSDDERWAAAFGAGPRDLPLAADQSPLPIAAVDTPAWSTTPADGHPTPGDAPPPSLGSRFDPWSFDDHADASAYADPSGDDDAGAFEPDGGGDLDDTRLAGPYDDLTRDHHVAGGRVAVSARQSAASDRPPGRRGGRRRPALVVAALAVVVAGVVAGVGTGVIGSGGGADASRSEPPAVAPGPDCPPMAAPAADVDGDGCPEALAVDGTTVDAGVAQWSLGEPGDLVTLGDWDCDGAASAALLRPTTGDVFVFSAWASADEPVTVSSSQRVDGGVGIRAVAGDGRCDQLLVDLAAGGAAAVEVPR